MDSPVALRDRLPLSTALRAQLLTHPVYTRVAGAQAARTFMGFHVFAVWDFMSLLKSLQQKLTCVDVPWIPPINRDAARLINEIVLGEESDLDGRGRHAGHYDLYIDAMTHVGADHRPIERFVNALRGGATVEEAFVAGAVAEGARAFVRVTLDIAKNGSVHEVASAFFLGREDVIPAMFEELLSSLRQTDPRMTERLTWYLSRHIEVDSGEHGPAAERLLGALCEDDEHKWAEADACAVRSLNARIALWDAVVAQLKPPRAAASA